MSDHKVEVPRCQATTEVEVGRALNSSIITIRYHDHQCVREDSHEGTHETGDGHTWHRP